MSSSCKLIPGLKLGYYFYPEEKTICKVKLVGFNARNKDPEDMATNVELNHFGGGLLLDECFQRHISEDFIFLAENLEEAMEQIRLKGLRPINLADVK